MSDTLYLSLWYPNLRLAALADKLVSVLGAFATYGGDARVYSATVWPLSWSESPVFQQVYGRDERGAEPAFAVEQALETLQDDYAYEFQIGWSWGEVEIPPRRLGPIAGDPGIPPQRPPRGFPPVAGDPGIPPQRPPRGFPPVAGDPELTPQRHSVAGEGEDSLQQDPGLDGRWAREPRLVRVTGYGPLFDEGAYEQDGHIRIDFGSDAAFLEEDAELNATAARHVEENVRQLVELTGAVEKGSGATARLLWSELGESLAQRLAARLGLGN
jgi:hypothetical protein